MLNWAARAARRLGREAAIRGLAPAEDGPAGVRDASEWVAAHTDRGARWLSAPLPAQAPLPPPQTLSAQASEVFAALEREGRFAPGMVRAGAELAQLPDARVVGPDGLVIASDGLLLREGTWEREKLESSELLRMRRLPRARVEHGAHATLISAWCDRYFHWITEVLPRIAILEATGQTGVPLIVPEDLAPWQLRSLELLGVAERLTPYRGSLRAERLLWPLPVAMSGHVPRWACEWLRRRLAGAPPPAPSRLLYLARGRGLPRRVANEREVWSLLEARGFELVNPEALSFDEQIKLFAGAACVVAPHGGALTNLVFSRGAVVVELFEGGYVNPCYYELAARCDHAYWCLIGSASAQREVSVDVEQLEATLEAATVRRQDARRPRRSPRPSPAT